MKISFEGFLLVPFFVVRGSFDWFIDCLWVRLGRRVVTWVDGFNWGVGNLHVYCVDGYFGNW